MKGFSELVEPALVWTGKVMLEGRVAMPKRPVAAAVFAAAPALFDEERDQRIIAGLYDLGVVTVYVPLLAEDELQFDLHTTHFRFDAEFLGQRFLEIGQWLRRNRTIEGLPLGMIGSSGGAAGALVAASLRPDLAAAVVSIDGRTDLAVDYLKNLKTPTLLMVKDMPVLRMNREALTTLRGDRRLEIVHDSDPHALDSVVQKSIHWFEDKLALVPADAYGMF